MSLRLPEKLVPQDVRTHWNSMFDMLDGAIEYKQVVNKMCASKVNRLRQYKLSKAEWCIVRQLQLVLKVRILP